MNTTDHSLIRRFFQSCLATTVLLASVPSMAGEFEDTLLDIQHRWAEANYEASGKNQKKAFAALLDDARAFASDHDDRAEALVWHGIVASTYAGVKGPFGAMSLAKEARSALLAAESLDPSVLDGSVYTSLGTLYSKVPGGIIGFGDKDLARDYFRKAIAANPDGIDPNYFYGEYLYEQEEFEAAKSALLKAQQAPARPDRPLADEGRQHEVADLLAQVDKSLSKKS